MLYLSFLGIAAGSIQSKFRRDDKAFRDNLKNQLSKGFACMFIFDEFELPDLTKKLLHVTISKKFGNLVDFRNCVYNIMPIML